MARGRVRLRGAGTQRGRGPLPRPGSWAMTGVRAIVFRDFYRGWEDGAPGGERPSYALTSSAQHGPVQPQGGGLGACGVRCLRPELRRVSGPGATPFLSRSPPPPLRAAPSRAARDPAPQPSQRPRCRTHTAPSRPVRTANSKISNTAPILPRVLSPCHDPTGRLSYPRPSRGKPTLADPHPLRDAAGPARLAAKARPAGDCRSLPVHVATLRPPPGRRPATSPPRSATSSSGSCRRSRESADFWTAAGPGSASVPASTPLRHSFATPLLVRRTLHGRLGHGSGRGCRSSWGSRPGARAVPAGADGDA